VEEGNVTGTNVGSSGGKGKKRSRDRDVEVEMEERVGGTAATEKPKSARRTPEERGDFAKPIWPACLKRDRKHHGHYRNLIEVGGATKETGACDSPEN